MIAKQFGEGVWINAVRSCRKQNKTLARPAIEDKMKPQLKVTEFRVNEFCLQAVTLDQQYRLPVSSRTLPYPISFGFSPKRFFILICWRTNSPDHRHFSGRISSSREVTDGYLEELSLI
ncbi:hypothetical protein RRG08_002347 [Elysia crispata]|uniref:Uncharacterized protein n=1 Tax=Elysia crispata TaxID=231223 RepID=A0AAE0ZBC7_9GAST|nr:hypothetical protein RRG08_002347 [Elysia crispata]